MARLGSRGTALSLVLWNRKGETLYLPSLKGRNDVLDAAKRNATLVAMHLRNSIMIPGRRSHSSGTRDNPGSLAPDLAIAALRHAIGNENDTALLARLQTAAREGAPLRAIELSNLLDDACAQNRSPGVKRAIINMPGFDPNAAGASGRAPLICAMRSGDINMMRYLLLRGADPARPVPAGQVIGARQETIAMLHAARVNNKLFPRSAPLDDVARTPLGIAMRSYDLPLVHALLATEHAKNPNESTLGLWLRAVRERRFDIHYAVLATRPSPAIEAAAMRVDQEGRSPLHAGTRRSPPALRAYLKQYPYYSDKRGPIVNANETARFSGSGIPIVCRHLVSFWIQQRANARSGKVDYSMLQSPEQIVRHVPPSMEQKFLELRAHAAEAHLFDKSQWGDFLAKQFESMIGSDPTPAASGKRRLLINSCKHVMAAELKLETRPDGQRQYGVLLYDPNATNVHKRASTSDSMVAGQWKFTSFLRSPETEVPYFPDGATIVTAYVISQAEAAASPSVSRMQPFTEPGRRATSCPSPLNPVVFQSLVRGGFDGDLWRHKDEIVAHLRSLPVEDAVAFLSGATENNMPALQSAMLDGYDGSVAAFAGIVSDCRLPRAALIRLIEAKDADGIPALGFALHEGNGAVLGQFVRLLQTPGLRPADKVKLLLARDANGIPGVVYSSLNGHDEAVEMFHEMVVEHFNDKQQETIWAAIADGVRIATGIR